MNENIDEYKDDFYKGLTLRQTVISIVTVAVGVAVFLFFFLILRLPQEVCLYLTLPVIFPIAAYGFLKIKGMNTAEYIAGKRKLRKKHVYYFCPEMLSLEFWDGDDEDKKTVQESTSEKRKGRPAKYYLETEETIEKMAAYGGNVHESNEGLQRNDRKADQGAGDSSAAASGTQTQSGRDLPAGE